MNKEQNTSQTTDPAIAVEPVLTAGLLINYCKECDKPLYTRENIERFGFDTRNFCRSNRHLETVLKTCR